MGDRLYSASVVAPAAFAALASPAFSVPWVPSELGLLNEDDTAANYVEYSFDGVTVHGRLTPGINAGVVYDVPRRAIWVRRGAGAPVVRLFAVE